MNARSSALPDFPWDLLEPAKAKAAAYPDGIVDLSVGTPVDPVPPVVRQAIADNSDTPGYPLTAGTPALRDAIGGWLARHGRTSAELGVLPTIGSKELVAWLPTLLGVGPGDRVVIPSVCYPTYEVGARLAGAEVIRSDSLTALGPDRRIAMIWINSPSNPTGRVLPVEHLRKVVTWARERGVTVVSDECYLTLGWESTPVSILDDRVTDGDPTGVIAVHSLSKRSNLAGYRAGFVGGDKAIIRELLAVRKHAGMIVPAPVQAAMVAALTDETHVDEQRARYAARRDVLRTALVKAGFEISHSEAGLYLWATRDEECWATVDRLAARGILAAPGAFYGPSAARHVRVALTASDERVSAAADRLAEPFTD
ncbi:succinyldiaminopimelate transaminase [Actinoplanes sp. NBRC 101535]|uniref:succinyldiaminopimelate transaminase n=1 Tax=Actinoplanes sp. NBRC 101535 TaxID=3032196 RepID=UPI0025522AE2|nr:succinyldiaminopimelate transaminase [Actinoplanes sp. NBRC 101535]